MRKVSPRNHHAETPYQAGRKWDKIYVETPFRYGKEPSLIARRLSKLLLPAATVIELGGGYGRDAVFLAKKGHRVLTMDISREARNLGTKFAQLNWVEKNITFITKDASRGLGLGNRYADAVFANLFFNLVEPGNVAGLLEEIMGVLVPGGHLLFGVRTKQDSDYLEGETVSGGVKKCNGFTCYFYERGEAKKLFMDTQFSYGTMEHVRERTDIAGEETVADLYLFELVK